MTTTTDESERAIAVVEAFVKAMEQQDFARVQELLHDDVIYQIVPLPADRGKPAVLRTLQAFTRFVTKFEVKMVNIAARGPVVLTERIDILSGPWVYLDIWVCGTFEVRDEKIVLWRDYFDLAGTTAKLAAGPVRKLLGLTPT